MLLSKKSQQDQKDKAAYNKVPFNFYPYASLRFIVVGAFHRCGTIVIPAAHDTSTAAAGIENICSPKGGIVIDNDSGTELVCERFYPLSTNRVQ